MVLGQNNAAVLTIDVIVEVSKAFHFLVRSIVNLYTFEFSGRSIKT